MTAEAEIRQLIENWVTAVRARDAAGLMTGIAPGVLMFDLINPLQYAGAAALKKRAEEWLSSFQEPLDYEVRDLTTAAGSVVMLWFNRVMWTGSTSTEQSGI